MSTRTVFLSGFLLIILELLFLSGTGCNLFAPQRQDRRITPGEKAGRMEDAQELVRSYMDARLAEVGEEELNAYLTDEARGDYQGRSGMTLTGTAEVPLLGYRIFESSKVTPGEFGFSTAIQTSATNRPEAENLREDIIVRVIEEEYRVSSSRFLGRSSVRVRQSALIWEKDNITRTLMSLNDLPAEFSPVGSKGARFGAGREGFTTLAIRPDDKEVAFATWGTHGLIGVVSTTQQAPPTVLDLLFESQAKLMAYSPTGDYLAVEEAAPTGSSRLRVYRIHGRRLVDLGLTQAFPPDRYHLNISRWESDGKTLLVRVNRFNQDAVDDRLGTWAIDVESGDRQKIIL
jgi:hypothetical protein